MEKPTDTRLYKVLQAFRQGYSIDKIHDITRIDKWFLYNLEQIIKTETEIRNLFDVENDTKIDLAPRLTNQSKETWLRWKQLGFSDEQITRVALDMVPGDEGQKNKNEDIIKYSLILRDARIKKGVIPVVKKIDTTAAEYPSPSKLSLHVLRWISP